MKQSCLIKPTVAFVFLAVLLNSAFAERVNPDSKNFLKSLSESFNQQPRPVRPGHKMMPTTYVEQGDDLYYYVIPRRLKRLGESGERFTLKKFRFKSDYVGIEIRSESGAKLNIHVYSEKEMDQFFYNTVVPGVLRDLFEFDEPWSFQGVIANSRSNLVHLAGANHLPAPEFRDEFDSLQKAEAAGYKPCTICFEAAHWIPVEGYIASRKAAIEAARTQEVIYPPVRDEKIQNDLQRLGEKIVGNFPVTVMGYNYEFKVLHSELPWAESFPTGFVFVSDRLLEIIEDSRELEFILAHEIAHVELFFKAISFDPWEAHGGSVDASTLNAFYSMLRAWEKEADMTALIYMAGAYRDSSVLQPAVSVLRKMQSFGETVPTRASGDFDSHPAIRERVAYMEENFFIPLAAGPRFCDLNDEETILTAEVLGFLLYKEIPRLILRISANDLMNKEGKLPGNAKVISEDGKQYKISRTDFPKYIGRNQSRIFFYDFRITRFDDAETIIGNLENISGIDLGNIGGASEWKVCTD